MHSDDYRDLMRRIHEEGYEPQSVRLNVERVADSYKETTSIELEKDGQVETFTSEQHDVAEFGWKMKTMTNAEGEPEFRKVRDLDQYWEEVDFLIDEDGTKLEDAMTQVAEGDFTFSYDPDAFLEEALLEADRPHAKRYKPLKRDYFRIVAYYMLAGRQTMEGREQLVDRVPGSEKFMEATEEILIHLRPSGNPMKDFRFYRQYVALNLPEFVDRVKSQRTVMNETIRDLLDKGSASAEYAVPRLLDIYKTVLELSAPMINVIRVGLELSRGVEDPQPEKGLTENIEVIRSSGKYGEVFSCLDPHLRHGQAHASYKIEDDRVIVYDYRSEDRKVVGEYTFEELAEMVREAHQEFFRAVLKTLLVSELAMKLMVLVCPEYKFYVLGIGNSTR